MNGSKSSKIGMYVNMILVAAATEIEDMQVIQADKCSRQEKRRREDRCKNKQQSRKESRWN